ncbi:MAG: hypothetical protein HDR26_04865 [Lachnospiraceae bacterium]|nr:hypothetical protein [Lachnospiraceae bacterium]
MTDWYQINRADALRFALFSFCQRMRKISSIVLWLFSGLMAYLYLELVGVLRKEHRWIYIPMIVGFLFLLWLMILCIIYRQVCLAYSGASLRVRLEEGWLVSESSTGGRSEMALTNLSESKKFCGLLLVKFYWFDMETFLYVIIPERVFGEKSREEDFLRELNRQAAEACRAGVGRAAEAGVCQNGQEQAAGESADGEMCFSYMVDAVWQAAGREMAWRNKKNDSAVGKNSEQELLNMINAGKKGRFLLGEWKLYFSRDKIRYVINGREWRCGWGALRELMLMEDAYVFAGEKSIETGIILPRSVFGSLQEELDFQRYCFEQGLEISSVQGKIFQQGQRRRIRGWRSFWIAAAAFLFVFMWKAVWNDNMSEYDIDMTDGGAALSPYDYPDYMPLEKQRSILEELGLAIPDDVVKQLQQNMEENDRARIYIESYPFYSLLSFIAVPKRDRETWRVTEYPRQAYWFDWEAADVEGDYENILRGLESISGGELSFEKIVTDSSQVDWEWGEGTITLSFVCCGKPFEIEMRVENDWLDPGVIDKLNRVIGQVGTGGEGKRIYACGDGGQGVILFYCDADWAREFTRKTGIEME